MTVIGRERTVEELESASRRGQCSMCGREGACRFHNYTDQFVIYDFPVVTYNAGTNRYCRYCSDGQVIALPNLSKPESIAVNESRELPVPSAQDLYRVEFHRVSEDGLRNMVAYIRSNNENSQCHWTGPIKQISGGYEETLTKPVLEALRWWTVKALKDDNMLEREKSEYYDVLCDIRNATEMDQKDKIDMLSEARI